LLRQANGVGTLIALIFRWRWKMRAPLAGVATRFIVFPLGIS